MLFILKMFTWIMFFEVRFVPLDVEDDESISDLLLLIDNTIQHGENLEVYICFIILFACLCLFLQNWVLQGFRNPVSKKF